ncbi:MAG: hypothetical protein AAFQ45_04660 [Pseudomonadota bacterium]
MSKRRDDIETLKQHAMDLDALTASDWSEPPKQKRDWKKVVLIVGLGTLSWVATYIGMLELIQANMGSLTLATKVVIGFSVAMLMTMIIWLLDQMFAPLPFSTKVAYLFGYIFLTTISVGFGFGFYWKVLESRSEATRSAESAVGQVQSSLTAAGSRLGQLQSTLAELTAVSSAKAIEERERGTSCPNSRPGDGPRRKLRDDDAARFGYASNFVKGRATSVKQELRALDGDLKKITSRAPSTIDPKTGTRNAFLRDLSRKLELTAAGFNAFRTDPQLRQIRSDLDQRAGQTIFPSGRGDRTFSCPDPQLQAALRGVVRAIDQLPTLGKPHIATVEGSEAVIEAFRRLTATMMGALAFRLPPSADEMRELQKRAIREAENSGAQPKVIAATEGGLAKRDFVPLAIALFVDICLLLVSIGRPMNRIDNLLPRMRSAERGPVYQILSKFSDIHADPDVRRKFELFRHVVFDFNGDYYIAVPLDAPRDDGSTVRAKLQQEAHLLANLFASFENEKIFSRVVNPLLSTKAVQKRLKRQGSSFANAKAFRVYRFRSGAWSEIILGAVMGAARRAELQRRQQALAEGLTLPDAPRATTSTTPDPAASPAAANKHWRAPSDDPIDEPRDPANDLHQNPQPIARPQPASLAATFAMAVPATAGETIPDVVTQANFGPYAASAARDLSAFADPDDVASRQAALRTQPAIKAVSGRPASLKSLSRRRKTSAPVAEKASQSEAGDDNVVIIAPPPAAEAQPPAEPTVDVRIVERSATVSIPASDARIPGALLDALDAPADVQHTIETRTADIAPPPLPLAPPEAEALADVDVVENDVTAVEWDEPAAVSPSANHGLAEDTEAARKPEVVLEIEAEEPDAFFSRFAPNTQRPEAAE